MEIATQKTFNNVDEYIAQQPEQTRNNLELLRKTIKSAAPMAEEVISYQMPAYNFNGILVWFAAFRNHYGLFVGAKTLEVFKDKLASYELGKGTIRFPLYETIPVNLVSEIVKYKVNENLKKKPKKSNA